MAKLNTFQRVRELGHWQSVVFAATLLERMYPNWQLFCDVAKHDDQGEARKVLDMLWQSQLNRKIKINVEAQLENLELVTPEASSYDMFGVYPAIDFVMSLSSALQFTKSKEQADIVNVSKMSQGTVVSYIEAHEPNISNEQLREDPLMLWEVEFQNELMDLIYSAKKPDQIIDQLKRFALQEGCSNIGIEPLS